MLVRCLAVEWRGPADRGQRDHPRSGPYDIAVSVLDAAELPAAIAVEWFKQPDDVVPDRPLPRRASR